MDEKTKDTIVRFLLLLIACAMALGVLWLTWKFFVPDKTIPVLNALVAFAGFSLALASVPKFNEIWTTSPRTWFVVFTSLLVAALSLALFGLSIEWLAELSQRWLIYGLWAIIFCIVVSVGYLVKSQGKKRNR